MPTGEAEVSKQSAPEQANLRAACIEFAAQTPCP